MSGTDLLALVALLGTVFTVLWWLQRRTSNASWADAGWALGVGAVTGWRLAGGAGDEVRRGVAAALAGLWALRLGGHLVRRALARRGDAYRRYQAATSPFFPAPARDRACARPPLNDEPETST